MRTERRLAPRYPFIATAEIIDEKENARKSSQVRDLSLQGCHVEMINPFPEGTSVMIEIYTETEFLEAGRVAYFEPKQGMGLTFSEMPSISPKLWTDGYHKPSKPRQAESVGRLLRNAWPLL